MGNGSVVACVKCLVNITHNLVNITHNKGGSLIPLTVVDTSLRSDPSPNQECKGGMVDDTHTPAGVLDEIVQEFWLQEHIRKNREKAVTLMGVAALNLM